MSPLSISAAIVVLASVGLGGCAFFGAPGADQTVAVRPANSLSDAAPDNASLHYQVAVAAIDARDYAKALGALQLARAEAPNEVRILNAFGVVYDKLGRFDLSARYYGQALALEPGSARVAMNLAYSHRLQGLDAPAAHAAIPRPPEPATPEVRTVTSARPIERAALLGRPLDLGNHSGQASLSPEIRTYLINRGWSAPRLSATGSGVRPRTTISYPEDRRQIAVALARTLPGSVDLVPCDHECSGVALLLGSDARRWRLSRPASQGRSA